MPRSQMTCVEEHYRALCLRMLIFRFGYYVRGQIIISEKQYNVFHALIVTFEKRFPQILHPESPTQTVGSDRPADYPQAIVAVWMEHERTGSLSRWATEIDELIKRERKFLKGLGCNAPKATQPRPVAVRQSFHL